LTQSFGFLKSTITAAITVATSLGGLFMALISAMYFFSSFETASLAESRAG